MKRTQHVTDSFLKRHQMSMMIIGVAVVLAMLAAGLFSFQRYDDSDVSLSFCGDQTAEAVRDTLKSRLGSVAGMKVYMMWRIQGGDPARLRGGYTARHGQTYFSIGRALAKGRQTPVRVTFNNVRTLDELAAKVTRNLAVTPEQFIAACDSVLAPLGFRHEQYVAAFVPDTYEFYWTVSPSGIVSKLYDYRCRFWNTERISKAEVLGLEPIEVATIASIVEEETAKADERPKVARLYLNRLSRHMKLQADPTVKFASGDFAARRISGAMLATVSPYNTYRVKGLPPGPIRVADKRAIDDVLDAPMHPYIYMCAREDFSGYHNFATDYASHMANARRYQAELTRRGIH